MMKLYLNLILLLIVTGAFAQTPATRTLKVTETSIVKDSAGYQYPYVIWQKLNASGDYWLKAVDPMDDNTEFLLLKRTEQQKAEMLKRMPRPADSQFFTTGQAITPFRIKDLKGNKIEAKDWAGKTVVLNFWFLDCPPCRAEIPDLNKLALKYKDNPNVLFIAVALDEGWQVNDFIKKNPLAYHLVGDGRSITKQFDIHLYPTNVVIDKTGKVQLHYSGGYLNGPYWLDKTIQESDKAAM